MPRRGHKKSRAGCTDCKRRHLKCDESHPSCVNCKVAALKCSYLRNVEPTQSATLSSASTPAYSPLTPEVGPASTARQNEPAKSTPPSEPINLDHLELLHHYENWTYGSFTTSSELALQYRETAVSNALRFPFLMYAILAVSAMHLSRVRPERSDHYRSLATSLQGVGLSRLKDTLLNITEDNVVAVFMFSTFTGLHSFSDTFSSRDLEFNQFLDKLTNSIQLMRGVRSIMGGGWWEYLQTSELAGLLSAGDKLRNADIGTSAETKPLRELLDAADIGPSSLEVYKEAVSELQRVFSAEISLEHAERTVSVVFAWPVVVSAEYSELLIQRRPEALIILAYYGVVLHRRRDAWAVGDAGEFLIQSISRYLGRHWERWFEWPMSVISSTTPPTTNANSC